MGETPGGSCKTRPPKDRKGIHIDIFVDLWKLLHDSQVQTLAQINIYHKYFFRSKTCSFFMSLVLEAAFSCPMGPKSTVLSVNWLGLIYIFMGCVYQLNIGCGFIHLFRRNIGKEDSKRSWLQIFLTLTCGKYQDIMSIMLLVHI